MPGPSFLSALRTHPAACLGAVLLAAVLLTGCYRLMQTDGGGMTDFEPPRRIDPSDVLVPEGYRIEVAAVDLTFPTGVAFDAAGRPHVTEAGYAYGGWSGVPRLLRIEADGSHTPIATGTNPPWNGVAFHRGAFYVAGGHADGGEVLRITPGGGVRRLVGGLPSYGDHHTNGPAVGPDGALYIGQGTATNAAVVGLDNLAFGWLARRPDFHDVPCEAITLTGHTYRTPNPLTDAPDDWAVTSPYHPFGQAADSGATVPGALPCGGAVFRLAPRGGAPTLVAWGFRNPFGLAFDAEGRLYVTDNSYDDRGSRPAWGTSDYLWRVEAGAWYGWPDFAGGVPLREFAPPGGHVPTAVLATPPDDPPHPAASFGVHASANGFDIARGDAFGHYGDAFIAQFGDMAPQTGKVLEPVGFQVVRVDLDRGVVYGFAENAAGKGPASKVGGGGLERPISARFGPDGALYVVDFGVMTVGDDGPTPRPSTGVLWKITKAAGGDG